MSTLNDLTKEIDGMINKTFSEIGNDMKKSFDENLDQKAQGSDISIEANGGEDIIKNKDEKEKGIEEMKKKDSKYSKSKDEDEDDSKDGKKDVKKGKAEDRKKIQDKEDELEDKEDEMLEDDKKEEKKKDMKKSFEIDQADYELLVKAKQEKAEKDRLEKIQSDPLYKSVEGLTNLIKGLNDKINTLQQDISQIKKLPAREPKSLDGVQSIEKSQNAKEGQKFKKSQYLDVMLDLQKSTNNGVVTELHISEFESCGTISDPEVKKLVQQEIIKKFS